MQAIAWRAQTRLCGRYQHLIRAGKIKVQVCTAIARELTGFLWAVALCVSKPMYLLNFVMTCPLNCGSELMVVFPTSSLIHVA